MPTQDEQSAQASKDASKAPPPAKTQDEILRDRATGVMSEETRRGLLALGEDATRASPVDPNISGPPGLTTTTGAYRTPIDPTTAAVPMDSEQAAQARMRAFGTPTIGSGKTGVPETLYMSAEDARKRDASSPPPSSETEPQAPPPPASAPSPAPAPAAQPARR